ncbi:hypothetical protein [Microbacterium yannicii]|uniref:hypothetical protein n=1 Tax=Microbacterium yannicii TaxID=671622 RepID=UPI000308E210|nr:hypothetical protein [Microbacterium yannicii]
MNARRDDDALSWTGDDDPTLDAGVRAEDSADEEAPPALPAGYTAVGKGSEAITDESAAGAESRVTDASADGRAGEPGAGERAPMGNAALISLGVIGGVYALFAIGWLIGGLRLQGWRPFLVTDAMFQGSLWLAVLTPVLWFATVFLLTRASRAWVRFAWLGAGVVLLVPWPFVMIGAMGQ